MKKLAALLILLCLVAVAAWAANIPPTGNTGDIQMNGGSGRYAPLTPNYGLQEVTSGNQTFLNVTVTGGGGTPGTPSGSLQYNNNGSFAGLSANTLQAYAAHDTVSNGLAYDPRNNANNPGNPAICHAPDVFTSDGHTTTYNYTTPFVGTSSTDNTNFYVYTITGGTATILTTSQFSVIGVNSGVGGTITLQSAPSNSSYIVVLHDDTPGIQATATLAAASGGYVAVPDNCWVQNMTWANGGNMIGQGFSPNYAYDTAYQKPIMHIISPPGHALQFGINLGSPYISQAFFEGFTLEEGDPTVGALTNSQTVAVCLGTNAGAGGGIAPGIVAQYMDLRECIVGFGAPVGGSSSYIFAATRFDNFSGNEYGVYGPFSDWKSTNDDAVSNSIDGVHIGPQESAAGFAGADDISGLRTEYNNNGIYCDSCTLVTMSGIQSDSNGQCGIKFSGAWSNITINGGWMRGNANGGYPNYQGNTTAGQDAHLCFSGTSSTGGGLHMSGVNFITNWGIGATAPLGSNNATSPPYILDFTTTGADNNNIDIQNGEGWFSNTATGNNASVTDFAIYRNGRPSNLKIDLNGQATQGKIANGSFSSQARGLPSNQWGGYYVFGDAGSYNNQVSPLSNGYAAIVGKKLGVGPTYYIYNSFSVFDCDVVNTEIIPNVNPTTANNPLMTWLPTTADPTYGGGFYTNHLTDTHTCHLGALTWMATPRANKVYGQAAGCVQTGSGWTNSANYSGYYGVTDNTNGDSLACTTTTNGAPIYLWYGMDTTSGGTFTWQLDSSTTGSVTVAGASALGAGTKSMGAVRIPVPSAGSHTITSTISSTTTTGNAVTIYGIGSPPNKPYDGSAPMVVFGGQIQSGPFSAASTAFNNDEYNMAMTLFADGLQVGFADVQNYVNPTNDIIGYPAYPSTQLYSSGQLHVADAFNAKIQGSWNSMNAVNPLDYGASCNTQFLAGNNYYGMGNNALTSTASSPVISISNYTFQPGTATQYGGGDVGKVVSINCQWYNTGTTTYIASVNTSNNTATLGRNSLASCNPGMINSMVVMGGYPSNPNDPSTAQDDTAAIHAASVAAAQQTFSTGGGTGGGGKVFLPDRCLIHNLVLANGVTLEGNNGGNDYASGSNAGLNRATTKLYVASSSFVDDIDTTTNLPRNIGINVGGAATEKIRLKDFAIQCASEPYFGLSGSGGGMDVAGIGTTGAMSLMPEAVVLDHVEAILCPVGFGFPFGLNFPVSFTASISGTTMTVASIDSTNFSNIKANEGGTDFLALGRTISGPGVTTGTTITGIAPTTNPGNAGTYTVSLSQTVTSESMTSPALSGFISGTSRNSTYDSNGIGVNGDASDWAEIGDVFTGDYSWGVYMGPDTGGNTGNGADRILGGRFEENGQGGTHFGGGFACDQCGDTQLTGVQWQFNSGPAILMTPNSNNLQITGGMLQQDGGGGEIYLEGNAYGVDVSGTQIYSFAANTQPLFFTATGYTGGAVSVEGGAVNASLIPTLYNFTNGVPSSYKQDVSGYAYIDTSQKALGTTFSGNVTAGTSSILSMGNGASAAYVNAATTSVGNTVYGFNALKVATTTADITALGYSVLVADTTGTDNTGIGFNALKGNTIGSFNTAIGSGSGTHITTGSNNIVLGPNVASTTLITGSNDILIGTTSAIDATTSSTSNYLNLGGIYQGDTSVKSVWLGAGSLTTTATDGFVEISGSAGVPTGTPTAHSGFIPLDYNTSNNTLYAYNSGWNTPLTNISLANTTSNLTYYLGFTTTTGGSTSTLYGTAADLTFNASTGTLGSVIFNTQALTGTYQITGETVLSFPGGDNNSIAVGYQALSGQSTAGLFNTAVGLDALFDLSNSVATYNTAIGSSAGATLVGGKYNTIIGAQALDTSTTIGNVLGTTVAGFQALSNLTSGANYNTVYGYQAGLSISSGTNNVVIGPAVASTTLTIGSNNILIGTTSAIDATTSSTNNFVSIGNLYEGNTSVKHIAFAGGLAAITSGAGDFGTAASISGDDAVGKVTIGSTPGGSGTVIFSGTWTNAPDACFCQDNTTAARDCKAINLTTTSMSLVATTSPFTGADQLGYWCPSHRL